MGKSDLIGSGSMWTQYSDKVNARMSDPKFRGEIAVEEANRMGATLVVADWGAESCGDAVRLYWAVDPDTHVIKKSAFRSFGCGTAIASSDMMAELTQGKTVDQALQITNIEVERALRDNESTPAVPAQKMHCSVMAYDVIKKAASIYKKVDVSALEDEDIVCECARITLSTVKDIIRINDLKSIAQVTAYTKAGAFCKSCIQPGGHEKRKYYLTDILAEVRRDMDKKSLKQGMTNLDFVTMNTVQRLKVIEAVLGERIDDMLASDGGSVEVVDIRDGANDTIEVFVEYSGACAHCPSSRTNTLAVIEEELKRKIHPAIRVDRI